MLKARVQQAFGRAAGTYAGAAEIQRCVAVLLANRLAALPSLENPPELIVDAGCGTGFAVPLLRKSWPQARLLALDLAEPMLAQLRRESASDSACAVCADLEQLPLADTCADLYWSSFTLQWCALPKAMAEAHRILKPGAWLALATVTSDTFHELRAAFAGIDDYSHTLDFLTPESIEAAVAAAGFSAVSVSRDRIRAHYPDLKSLLRSVRQVGAGEVGGARRRGLFGKHAWMSVEAQYSRFREAGQCPLTYDVLYVTARA